MDSMTFAEQVCGHETMEDYSLPLRIAHEHNSCIVYLAYQDDNKNDAIKPHFFTLDATTKGHEFDLHEKSESYKELLLDYNKSDPYYLMAVTRASIHELICKGKLLASQTLSSNTVKRFEKILSKGGYISICKGFPYQRIVNVRSLDLHSDLIITLEARNPTGEAWSLGAERYSLSNLIQHDCKCKNYSIPKSIFSAFSHYVFHSAGATLSEIEAQSKAIKD